MPDIAITFKLGHGALEWLVSIFLLGYAVGQLLYGPLANRLGRVSALRLGLMGNLLGILICVIAANSSSYFLLLIGRLISALGTASGLACTFMLINESLSKDQAKHAMSFSVVSFTVGIGLSVAIGGVVTHYLGWAYCFAVLMLHGFVMLYLTRYLKETLKTPEIVPVRDLLKALVRVMQNRQLVVFSFLVGAVSVFAYGYSATAPIFSRYALHLSANQYGYWNLVNMIGMMGSGFWAPFLMKRFGPWSLIMWGCIGLAPFFALLVLIAVFKLDSSLLFFVTSSGLYFFTGLLFPAASYFASNAVIDRGNAASAMSFVNMVSAMLGVVIIGYLPFSSLVAFIIVLLSCFVVAIFGAAICWLNGVNIAPSSR